jgi:hypothetical protein
MGHSIFVISAVGAEPEVREERARMLEILCGKDAFDDIICIDYFESKQDKIIEMGGEVLIDDGLSNISHAIEAGIAGILVRGEHNAALINDTLAGKSVDTAFWHFDEKHARLVREKAIIADGWPDIVSAIGKL